MQVKCLAVPRYRRATAPARTQITPEPSRRSVAGNRDRPHCL